MVFIDTKTKYILNNVKIKTIKTLIYQKNVAKFSFSIIPVILAAAPTEEEKLKKPPRMSYTQLPIYEDQKPHMEFNEKKRKQCVCSASWDTRLLRDYIMPTVMYYRCEAQRQYSSLKCQASEVYKEVYCDFARGINSFKSVCRDPCYVDPRRGAVLTGAVLGLFWARNKGRPSKVIGMTIGAMIPGALCFPDETDACVRTFFYYCAKVVLAGYNLYNNTNCGVRERIPCKIDMPCTMPVPESKCDKKP